MENVKKEVAAVFVLLVYFIPRQVLWLCCPSSIAQWILIGICFYGAAYLTNKVQGGVKVGLGILFGIVWLLPTVIESIANGRFLPFRPPLLGTVSLVAFVGLLALNARDWIIAEKKKAALSGEGRAPRATILCKSCGAELAVGAKFCRKCGAKV